MAATEVCEVMTPSSRYSFCTNGGKCKDYILTGEDHPGCNCPDDYEGMHCEFLKGMSPPLVYREDSIGLVSGSYEVDKSSKTWGGGVAFAILLGLVTMIAAIIWVVRKVTKDKEAMMRQMQERNFDSESEWSEAISDVEPDGSGTLPQATERDNFPSDGDGIDRDGEEAVVREVEII